MTIDQATEILYEEATRQGIAMNRTDCESMARKLLMIQIPEFFSAKPGDIAQHRRTRYEEDQEDLKILEQSSKT
jgi:hypothetical protein